MVVICDCAHNIIHDRQSGLPEAMGGIDTTGLCCQSTDEMGWVVFRVRAAKEAGPPVYLVGTSEVIPGGRSMNGWINE